MIYYSKSEVFNTIPNTSWTVLGKGPSFSRYSSRIVAERVMTLNDTIREARADLAHFIDIEALARCSEHVYHNAKHLIVPMYMHKDSRAMSSPLWEVITSDPSHILGSMQREERLLFYYKTASNPPPENTGMIPVQYFSSEAAMYLLAVSGVSHITTYGIDGGTEYAEEFKDLQPLTNGRPSFNDQQNNLELTCNQYNVSWTRF